MEMALIEIDGLPGLPMKNGWIFHGKLWMSFPDMVYPIKSH